ncbi:MAG: carbohydrate-binding domain-containing protein [Lachnospiraceae bacterium]|nr:carbohydrate-binding domain-containing protein [Lachnospiraceae bacterium]
MPSTLEETQDNIVGKGIEEGVRENINNEKANPSFQGETTIIDIDNAFSKRDLSGAYEESECEKITLSDGGSTTDSKGVAINANTITIQKEGTYMLDGSMKNGMIIVDVDKTEKVQLVLNGVDIRSDTSAPIYVKNADKVFVTLADKTTNTLTNGGSFEAIDDNNIDAVIFSKDDLTLNGTGSLTISSPSGHGIVSKNDLVITSGAYEIMAASHGLSGKDSVAIADGSFMITAEKDAIHSSNDEDDTVGWVYIENGNFDFVSDSDGISAVNEINIVGGNFKITKCEEGLEARLINISGGTINITASDDGLNATDKRTSSQTAQSENMGGFRGMGDTQEDANINITGGTVTINAEGDGIDSNGYITVSGGEVFVMGSSGGGDASLDYGISATISGGTVVAAGQSGMAVNFCDGSMQGSILVNIQAAQPSGTDVVLLDSNGNELIAQTIEKGYNSVVVSCPEIVDGGTYTLKMGTEETQITMDGLIYGEGHGMGGFGGGHGGMKGGDDGMPHRGGRQNGELPDGEMPMDGKMPHRGEKPNGERPNGELPPDAKELPNDEKPTDMER